MSLTEIEVPIKSGPVLVRESPAPISPIPRTPEVGVVIIRPDFVPETVLQIYPDDLNEKMCMRKGNNAAR
jgi:hypothetical protein